MIPEKNGLTRMVTSVQNERSRRQPHQTTFPLNSTLSILLSRSGVTHCCTIFLKFIPGIEILISISERLGNQLELVWTGRTLNLITEKICAWKSSLLGTCVRFCYSGRGIVQGGGGGWDVLWDQVGSVECNRRII